MTKKHKNWLKNHKEKIRYYLMGLVLVSMAIGIWYGSVLYKDRKEAEAMIAQRNALREEEARAEEASDGMGNSMEMPDFSGDLVTFERKDYRRNQYIKAILCLGVDRSDRMDEKRELGEAGQADGIFLIAQDTARNKLKLLMIPRDSMIEVTVMNADGSVRGLEADHLLMAYAYG